MTNKKVSLTPEVFKVNNQGEIIINDALLVEEIERASDELSASEQGIKISVSVSA